MRRIKLFGYQLPIPNHPIARFILGIALIAGGLLGFLPVLGFWMLPLGLIVLSIDFPMVRRFRRKSTVRLGLLVSRRWPGFAQKLGLGHLRPSR
jgi:purine-cytosine permease-like protein